MKIKQFFLLAALAVSATATLTSCDNIVGEEDNPAPVTPTEPETPEEELVYTFSLRNLADDADVTPTGDLTVTNQAGASITYTVSDGKYTIKEDDLGSATDLWFEATTATGKYIAKAKKADLAGISEEGKLKMATLGNIIGADGKFYANKTAAETASPVTTGAAMIVYLGDEGETSTDYKHGLAIALSDAISGTCTWGTSSSNTSLDDKNTLSLAIADMAGIANTATLKDLGPDYAAAQVAFTYFMTSPSLDLTGYGFSGWFLPSAGQWYKFLNGMCNLEWTDFGWATGTGSANFNAANKAFGDAGYDSFGSDTFYWSSSEYDDNNAVNVNFNSSNGVNVGNGSKGSNGRVRSFLAF